MSLSSCQKIWYLVKFFQKTRASDWALDKISTNLRKEQFHCVDKYVDGWFQDHRCNNCKTYTEVSAKLTYAPLERVLCFGLAICISFTCGALNYMIQLLFVNFQIQRLQRNICFCPIPTVIFLNTLDNEKCCQSSNLCVKHICFSF